MNLRVLIAAGLLVAANSAAHGVDAAQATARGTISGHIRLLGELPGNPVIRMTRDPMCAKINAGKRIIQETVAAALDGSLANVFVQLDGSFPDTPVPAEAVIIDQRGCVYTPRVVGVRLGQVLQVRNSDSLLHNVHGLSGRGNSFNIGQPLAGMVNQLPLKAEETMLKLSCDVHTWMRAYVGVVKHPYFAVTGNQGTFQIANVPAGAQTLRVWHEQYGELKQSVLVKSGATSTVDLTFSGTPLPSTAGPGDRPARRSAR